MHGIKIYEAGRELGEGPAVDIIDAGFRKARAEKVESINRVVIVTAPGPSVTLYSVQVELVELRLVQCTARTDTGALVAVAYETLTNENDDESEADE